MTYTSRDRDRGRLASVAVTGIGAVGALTATGWLMGAVATDAASEQAVPAAGAVTPAAPAATDAGQSRQDRARRPALRHRPYVTRVTLRYVTATRVTSSVPGPGGALTAGGPSAVSSSGSSGPGPSSGSGPGPAPAPAAAPAPAPAPAPSSGS